MSDIQINLVCCTQVILQDLRAREATQKDIALTYAMAIKSYQSGADDPDWTKINKAIVAKWSTSGLDRVKKIAWDILEGKRHSDGP